MIGDQERDLADLVARLRPDIDVRLSELHAAARNNPQRFDRRIPVRSNARLGQKNLALTEPHDPDYAVFRHVRTGDGTVLDIGANSGQSAASIWAAGSDARVLSFEPLPAQRPALEAIKSVRHHQFDYRIVALSDRDGEIELMVPIVNGTAATWLATAAGDVDWPKMGLTVATFVARRHYREGRSFEIDLAFVMVPARRLDTMLGQGLRRIAATGIAAIKIDVEGYETEVVAGAADTLAHHRPLLMIERAQDRPDMLRRLQALDYRPALREADRIVASDEPGRHRNTFFWHTSREDEYRKRGLLS
jgi:FkbM family methyltransferase